MSDFCRGRSIRENDCLLKLAEGLPENLSYLTSPLRDPIPEEGNAGTHIGCKSYYYGRRIGMLVICYACHGIDGEMHLIQINRSRNPGQTIKVGVAFSTVKVKG